MPRRSQSATSNPSSEVNIEDLMNKFLEMQKELEALKQEKQLNTNVQSLESDNYDEVEISPSAYIRVISLVPMELNLSTEPHGRGRIFTFRKFGDSKRIMYSDLLNIINSHENFLNSGKFFIADKRIIRKHDLLETYSIILNKESIEKVLSGMDSDTAFSLFKSTTKEQKETISNMIVDRRIAGEKVDLNFWDKVRHEMLTVNGVDIDEKYQTTRDYLDGLESLKEKDKQS